MPPTLRLPRVVSTRRLENSIPQKKTLTYKQQCPIKRQAYLDTLDSEMRVKGKIPTYVDEYGFLSSELRRYTYAPRGIWIRDKYRVDISMNLPPKTSIEQIIKVYN